MKKTRKLTNFYFLLSNLLILNYLDVCLAKDDCKNVIFSPTIIRDSQMIDANQIAMYIMNNGTVARHPETGGAGCYYPKGSDKTIAYTVGLFIVGKIGEEIRTACSNYNVEYQPGVILPDGIPDNPALEKYRVYKIRPGDSADPGSINYNKDYAEWPIENGAPVEKNGSPRLIGDQTLWCVMNDGDVILHNGFYNTNPLNLEVQLLVWAFNDDTTPLGKTVFLHYTIINKNSETIEDAYIGVFADMDIGNIKDDEAACDTTLNLSYGYNGKNTDEVYGASVPACGICLLQGPTVPSIGDIAFQFMQSPIQNARLLNINSNSAWIRFNTFPHPPQKNSIRLYRHFQGLDYGGNPKVDPTMGKESAFMNTGDPVTNSGWLQSFLLPPGDVYFMPGSGAFSLAPLDTQRIVYALIVGQNETRLESILDLKHNTNLVRDIFLSEFKIKASAETEVKYSSSTETELLISAYLTSDLGINSVRAELLNYDNSPVHAIELYDDGLHNDKAANDGFYGNIWQTVSIDTALYLNLKVVDASFKEYLFTRVVENITMVSNKITIPVFNVVADHVNNDGKPNPGENLRSTFNVTNNFAFDLRNISVLIKGDDPYVQMDPEYFFFSGINAGLSKGLTYDLDDRGTYYAVDIASNAPDTHTIYFDVTFFDNLHHIWQENNYFSLKVEPYEYVPNQIIPSHVAGYSDAYFVVRVINPAELTGHSYQFTISELNFGRQGFNLIDQTLGDTLLKNHEPPDEYAYNIPITDGFKVVKVYLPRNRAIGVFENVAGGHLTPFKYWAVASDGTVAEDLIKLGAAFDDNSYELELEFTNDIDTSGVIGIPSGQGVFGYLWFPTNGPQEFVPSTINVWKIVAGKRIAKLNACFKDIPPDFDGIYSPGDWLYIMSSNYDSSGQYYFDATIDAEKDMLCEIRIGLYLAADSSILDAGDKICISREFRATSEDMWIFMPTNVIEKNVEVPNSFALYQNYPNPFNPTTKIKFLIDKQSIVSLKIFNLIGQEIIEVINENLAQGVHSVHWDGKNKAGQLVSSGLYFAKLIANNNSKLIKMILIR